MKLEDLGEAAVSSAVFAGIGIIAFAIAFALLVKITPFSIRKEIEEDQNTSLGIIIAGILIGIALIISAAVHG
ncbi:MAG: DUF350 domain-containing protein [Kofleriaceae bacterium]|nr:DUF350 domain-containing protein [Kofleriaceae bacterium]